MRDQKEVISNFIKNFDTLSRACKINLTSLQKSLLDELTAFIGSTDELNLLLMQIITRHGFFKYSERSRKSIREAKSNLLIELVKPNPDFAIITKIMNLEFPITVKNAIEKIDDWLDSDAFWRVDIGNINFSTTLCWSGD